MSLSARPIFHEYIRKSIRSRVKSMIVNPLFSNGASVSFTSNPVATNGGVPRAADGHPRGPVEIGPVNTE